MKTIEKIKEIIKKGFYSESPYSESYYITNKFDELELITWNGKPNKSLRISDHWNFWSNGQLHCPLKETKEPVDELMVCIYDVKTKKYEILARNGEALEIKEYLISLLDKKKEMQKALEKKKIRKRVLQEMKLEKQRIKDFLENINTKKSKKDKENILKLIKEPAFYTTESRNRKYYDTTEYKLFQKYDFLFKNYTLENNAQRGGRLGEKIILSKRDINKILKAIGE